MDAVAAVRVRDVEMAENPHEDVAVHRARIENRVQREELDRRVLVRTNAARNRAGVLAPVIFSLDAAAARAEAAAEIHADRQAKLELATAVFTGALDVYRKGCEVAKVYNTELLRVDRLAHDNMLTKLTDWFRQRALDQYESCESELARRRARKRTTVELTVTKRAAIAVTKRLKIDVDKEFKQIYYSRTIVPQIAEWRRQFTRAYDDWVPKPEDADAEVVHEKLDEILLALRTVVAEITMLALTINLAPAEQLEADVAYVVELLDLFLAHRQKVMVVANDIPAHLTELPTVGAEIRKGGLPEPLCVKLDYIILIAVAKHLEAATEMQVATYTLGDNVGPFEGPYFNGIRVIAAVNARSFRNSRHRIIRTNNYVQLPMADSLELKKHLVLPLANLQTRAEVWLQQNAVGLDPAIQADVEALVEQIDRDIVLIDAVFTDVSAFRALSQDELVEESQVSRNPNYVLGVEVPGSAELKSFTNPTIMTKPIPLNWLETAKDADERPFWRYLAIWKKQALATKARERQLDKLAAAAAKERKRQAEADRTRAAELVEEARLARLETERLRREQEHAEDEARRVAAAAKLPLELAAAQKKLDDEAAAVQKKIDDDASARASAIAQDLQYMIDWMRIEVEEHVTEMEATAEKTDPDLALFQAEEEKMRKKILAAWIYAGIYAAKRGDPTFQANQKYWILPLIRALMLALASGSMEHAPTWAKTICSHVDAIMPGNVPGLTDKEGLYMYSEALGVTDTKRKARRAGYHKESRAFARPDKTVAKPDNKYDVQYAIELYPFYDKDDALIEGVDAYVKLTAQAVVGGFQSNWQSNLVGVTFVDAIKLLRQMLADKKKATKSVLEEAGV